MIADGQANLPALDAVIADVDATARDIRATNLPEFLATRIYDGR